MTPGERLLAVGIFAGTLLGLVVRALFWIVVGLVVVAGFVLLAVLGATKTGRQIEYGTRPRQY